jgi:hypothetical protein
VVDEPGCRPASFDRHVEGREDELGPHHRGHRPADDAAGEDDVERGEVGKPAEVGR